MFPVGLAPVPGWSHSAQSIFFFFFFQKLSLVFPSQSRIWLTGYSHDHWSPTTVPGRAVWMRSVLYVAPDSTCSRILVIHSQHLNSPSRRNYSPSSYCFQLSTLLTCLVVGFFYGFSFIYLFVCSFSPQAIWESTRSHCSVIHPSEEMLWNGVRLAVGWFQQGMREDNTLTRANLGNNLHLPLFSFTSCFDPSDSCTCTVHPRSNTSCFHRCPWKNSVTPAGIVLSGWQPSKNRMHSRNFARC